MVPYHETNYIYENFGFSPDGKSRDDILILVFLIKMEAPSRYIRHIEMFRISGDTNRLRVSYKIYK